MSHAHYIYTRIILELKRNATNPGIDDPIFVVILNDKCPRVRVEFVGVDETIVGEEINRCICKIIDNDTIVIVSTSKKTGR